MIRKSSLLKSLNYPGNALSWVGQYGKTAGQSGLPFLGFAMLTEFSGRN
jgi:hypothetical protein